MAFPVTVQEQPGILYELNQPSKRQRIKLASRTSALIPYTIASFFWLAVAFPTTVAAWFAILITGQYPPALFAMNARAWRFLVRVDAYAFLLVDAKPSFSGNRDPGYPLNVDIAPLPEYNRLLTGLRGLAMIPLMLVTGLAICGAYILVLPSLLMVTVFRHQPAGLQKLMGSAMHLHAKFLSSAFLLTEILWIN
jgi:hypothetical protein